MRFTHAACTQRSAESFLGKQSHLLPDVRGHRTFSFCLSFPRSGGCIDVPGTLEVDIFLHSNEVGCKLPHILSVIDDADHRVSAREEIPVRTDRTP